MTAKGKINASKVQAGDRIIIDTDMHVYGGDECGPSRTKTGESVQVGRVLDKLKPSNARGYIIVTNLGRFYAEPIQTMWLAPEDNAGIKRAHVEALDENKRRDRAATPAEVAAPAQAEVIRQAADAARQAPTAEAAAEIMAEAMGLPAEALAPWVASNWTAPAAPEAPAEIAPAQELTLHSHACNVVPVSTERHTEENTMTAKGKITAARVAAGDRILVKHYSTENEADRATLEYLGKTEALGISDTKTGQGVTVARVIKVEFATVTGGRRDRRVYDIHTTEGVLANNAPAQTMILAPEDAAGVKRAHAEALAEAAERQEAAEAAPAAAPSPVVARPAMSRELAAQMVGRVLRPEPVLDLLPPLAHGRELVRLADIAPSFFLTLDSHAGKVGLNSEDEPEGDEMSTETTTETQTAEQAAKIEHTGSTIVALIERVWDRIRAEHPELPAVVVTTGSGEFVKWGHFRPNSWKNGDERKHEFFLASEALAKGAHQVLQTTIHEAAHTLSNVRGQKDTSRQHRYHNGTFRKTAEELGLEHKASTPDKTHGFSFVTLTQATKDKYADLLAELDKELTLTGLLPFWMGGKDEEDEKGGEKITGKPKKTEGEEGEGAAKSGNLKATCACDEPNIIRLSRKVLDLGVVRCDSCQELFTA